MRHLYETGADVVLCGAAVRDLARLPGEPHWCLTPFPVAHVSHARRSDCSKCRSIYRARLRHRLAGSLRAAARQTEFTAVSRRLLAEADRLDAL